MIRYALIVAFASLLGGCSDPGPRSLGAAVQGSTFSVAAVRESAPDSEVVVQGKMTQKCPVAGCWFMVRDETGTIKVDTKNAGFVVVDVPLQTVVTAAGRVTTNGNERIIDATGLRY